MVEDRRSGRVGQAAVLEVLGNTRINCTIACSGSASARIDITSTRINNTREEENLVSVSTLPTRKSLRVQKVFARID